MPYFRVLVLVKTKKLKTLNAAEKAKTTADDDYGAAMVTVL